MHSSCTPYQLAKQVKVMVPPNSQDMVIDCTTSSNRGGGMRNAFANAYLQNRSSSAVARSPSRSRR